MENKVKNPVWILVYEGKDISEKISPYVNSATYVDHLSGQADEVEIVLEDRDDRWKNAWQPQKGDRIALRLGYAGEPLLEAGEFQVDEVEYNGPPDTVTIKGIAAGVKSSLRTRRSAAYERKSLKAIAQEIAARNGLTMRGSVPDLTMSRSSQHQETDLAYLKRLADTFGLVFSVKGTDLVWHDLDQLDQAVSIITIKRKGFPGRYTFRTKSAHVYRACTVTYFSAKLKKEISHTFTAKGITTGDTLRLVKRAENKGQAERMAMAALRSANGLQVEGSLALEGTTLLRAGRNLDLSGWGELDGQYQVLKATHRIERGAGYSTDVEFSMNGAHNMKELRNEKRLVKQ